MYLSIFTDELGLDLVKAVPILKEWGFTHCDLRARIFQRSLDALDDEQLKEVKKLLDANDLKVGCLQSSLAKVHLPDRERLDQEMNKLERLIRVSEILDCRMVRSFFFWQPPGGQAESVGELAARPDVLAQVMEMFLPFAERAKQAGLLLAFENCGCTKEECFKMLDALDVPEWGFAWDPKNTWMSDKAEREQDFGGYLNRLAKRTINCHVKSIGTISDDGGKMEMIPYDKVFEALVAAGFDGPVSLETHNFNKAIDNIDACRQVLEVVKRSWPSAAAGAQMEKSSISAETVFRPWADNPVRFAVVGLGMGHNRAGEMLKTPGVKLLQVCDLLPERAERSSSEFGVPGTVDFAEVLANPEVEAVMVMNETGHHAELACQALNAGKHVLVTKPFEITTAACDRMIRLAEEKNLLLAVDFCRRLRPSVQNFRSAVKENFFGRVLSASISLRIRRDMKYFQANGGWRGTRALDGGVLCNQAVHHLDELLYAFGMPEEVRCDAWTLDHNIEMEDLGMAVWRYADGMVANIYATSCWPQETWYYQMEVNGTEGAYVHREGGPLTAPASQWFHNRSWQNEPPVPGEEKWLNSMDNFAAALRIGASLLASPVEGRQAVKIMEAMYQSAYENNGGWIHL